MSTDLPGGDRGAILSDCERYRYRLWRTWDDDLPAVLFVMLNPSTADADTDDQTIKKCVKYARRWGAGGLQVCNLYAWRATKPRDLPGDTSAVSHPDTPHANDEAFYKALDLSARIIVAWGANPGPVPQRTRAVLQYVLWGRAVEALKVTKRGQPWHPLYVRDDTDPQPYRSADAT